MKIPFGQQTIAAANTPQPLVSTTLSSAVAATNPSKGSSTTLPGTLAVSLPVVSSAIFAVGDKVWIDTGAKAERQVVTAIADGTHITVSGLNYDHASGVYVIPAIEAASIYIQEGAANSAVLVTYYNPYYFQAAPSYGRGAQVPNATSLTQAVKQLENTTAPNQPQDEHTTSNNYGANFDALEYWWISGAANATYLVTLEQV